MPLRGPGPTTGNPGSATDVLGAYVHVAHLTKIKCIRGRTIFMDTYFSNILSTVNFHRYFTCDIVYWH